MSQPRRPPPGPGPRALREAQVAGDQAAGERPRGKWAAAWVPLLPKRPRAEPKAAGGVPGVRGAPRLEF